MKKVLTVLAALVVIVVVAAGAQQWLSQTNNGGQVGPPEASEATMVTQPEHCPRVEVLVAPGTWESSKTDDPFNPTANPKSFMLNISRPLQEAYPAHEVKVWTLPYTAQFKNINSQNEMPYDESREEGIATMETEMRDVFRECPLTDYILTGFSQGAVIAGDIANKIGTGTGVVPAERIRGVALIADGRREPNVGQHVGNPVGGVGAEIALQPLNLLVQPVVPGATMRGPRQGGFGALNDRTFEICAPNDAICDAPREIGNALGRATEMVQANGVHSVYATNPYVIPDTTANQWVVEWAKGLINR